MPDGGNPCRQPEGRLRQFEARLMAAGKDCSKKAKFCSDRGYAPNPPIDISQTATECLPPKKQRAKAESSRHFGVRFRPDLQKWVAEIRVFEWKSVDKKVWLGTFDTEVGAACAVDAARKLLKCQKKRPPNFPCTALSAYAESIPAHLQLTNITEEGMFKEVTMFVKRKAQEYAAGFCTGKGATVVGLREQLAAPQYQIQVGDGNGCFQLVTSDVESRLLFAVPEDDVFPTGSSYGTNDSFAGSFGSYESQFPSCDGVMSHHWGSPTVMPALTYSSSGPSSCSSEGTSPEDRSWVQVQPSMWTEEALQAWSQEVEIGGDYCLVAPSAWEDQTPMRTDEQTTIEVDDMECLFYMEEDQECCVGDQAIGDPIMNIFLGDEAQAMYVDNQYVNWTFQQSVSSLSYNPLSNSFDNREVCS